MSIQGLSGSAFGLNTHYQQHRSNLAKSVSRLASGDRFVNAGDGNAAELSISQRFRHRIRSADASTTSIQTAQAFLDTADSYSQTVTNILQRMVEIASSSTDGVINDPDRVALQDEFASLKHEITEMTRQNTFFGKQTIGREGMLSYDDNSKRMTYWQTTGAEQGQIERDFSSTALDSEQKLIGFDPTEAYTMSRDGKSVLFMGTVAGDGAGVLRAKRYDIETHTVYNGTDLFATGDTLHVDEIGQLRVNGSGTVYDVDLSSLARTATMVTDIRTGTEFTAYDGSVIYSRTADSAITTADPNVGPGTALTGALVFGVGVDHTFSGTGGFVAEESAPGSIRVIDSRTGNETTLAIGAGTSVNNIQFNADGDRIYYTNQDTNGIHYINVGTDANDNVVLTAGAKVVQGVNNSSFNGLELGGSTAGSSVKYVVAQDAPSVLSYEAIDLSLYNLRLADDRVDTQANAAIALQEVRDAQNRLSAQRAKIGAMASRFKFVLSSHRSYIANMVGVESQIRDVDLAEESTRYTSEQVQMQAAQSVLAQYNTLKGNVLRLLGA
ncbi:hypothetical protein SCG7086_AG_00260 [Chlamydiales bacterium SCGC AG-110-P3]|nr:hypothetical protein SCG7086_AG_00260 [Chlamydiales bacterium SCGC AG-110-P3]